MRRLRLGVKSVFAAKVFLLCTVISVVSGCTSQIGPVSGTNHNPLSSKQSENDVEESANNLTASPQNTENFVHGYIDKTGKMLVPAQYDYAGPFCEGMAVIGAGGKYGYLNTKGEVVFAAQFDDAWEFSEGLAVIKSGERFGYVSKDGKLAIKPQFNDATDFHEGLAAVEFENKYGYINKSGQVVISPRFDYADNFSDQLAYVQEGDRNGYIDMHGEMKFIVNIRDGAEFHEGLAAVAVDKPKRQDLSNASTKSGETAGAAAKTEVDRCETPANKQKGPIGKHSVLR